MTALPSTNDQAAFTVRDLAALAGRKFGTIYADPPWRYGNSATRAAASKHYPTMSIAEITALPVKDLAADCSHLHLWTTNAFLFEAKGIMDAWGFMFEGVFVWNKQQLGLGNYWRVGHEFMLLGVRGECPFRGRPYRSWEMMPRGRHSQKPLKVRRMIEDVSPGPRLELFGRLPADGWVVWGNQIERSMFDDDVKEL